MHPALDLDTVADFGTALLIGALIGIEREKRKAESGTGAPGGLRTFILIALVGASAGWMSHVTSTPWILVGTLAAVTVLALAGYIVERRVKPNELGLTTEVAAVATFLAQLRAMGRLVEERVQRAVRSLKERDEALARSVIDGDPEINQAHVAIDDRCFTLLALHQPMAGDLRTIVAGVKMASDLERVGDLAVNIAQAVLRYLTQPPVSTLPGIERMAELATAMLHDALEAFTTRDAASAQRVLDRDDTLDDLKASTFREFLDTIRRDPRLTESAINLILVSRHLERIGDHATNIAEDVIFIVTARDVRHPGTTGGTGMVGTNSHASVGGPHAAAQDR